MRREHGLLPRMWNLANGCASSEALTLERCMSSSAEGVDTSAGGYEEGVAQRLREALGARECRVVDQSGGCGASFAITVEAEAFKGKSRLQRQRMVQEVIRDEIAKWHAVTIATKVPEE